MKTVRGTTWRRARALLGVPLLAAACEGGTPADSETLSQASALTAAPACDPAVCGQNSGLVPFHKDAIHAGLIWREYAACPKMIVWMRPGEYRPKDYLNPTVTPGVFPGFLQAYTTYVQGGFGQSGLDRSGWSRYAPDIDRENTQLIDVCGLQRAVDRGLFRKAGITELTDDDISLTDRYFRDAGYSRGLGQNLFCGGNVVGIDGRLIAIGGHDKGGNNGLRKISIFDPVTQRWAERPIPCVRTGFAADPDGKDATLHCDPRDEANTDPPSHGDMKYQRWYPAGVALPDGRVLVLSGTDQDTSKGPGQATNRTKIRQDVPEVYDPWKDETVALENAKKLMPMYVRSFVVQTGRGWRDWKVCTTAEAEAPFPTFPLPDTQTVPETQDIAGYDPFYYNGNTYCLDVLGALGERHRKSQSADHWALVDKANASHDSGAGVRMVTINADGTWSQKVFLFGGDGGGDLGNTVTAEVIDFSDPTPRWKKIDDLVAAVQQNNAAVLPDGNILIVGGTNRGTPNLQYQMYDAKTGKRTNLITSPVPRHDHSTALLVPTGGVWVMGGNRVDLLPEEQSDLSVPVMEYYQPPYFFKGPRPRIKSAPHKIHYGERFKIEVRGGDIASVALLRTGPITHNSSWGNQYVKLPVEKRHGKLLVTAPPLPGLAVGGDYMMFAVTEDGIPSEGRHVRLEFGRRDHGDDECDREDDHDHDRPGDRGHGWGRDDD